MLAEMIALNKHILLLLIPSPPPPMLQQCCFTGCPQEVFWGRKEALGWAFPFLTTNGGIAHHNDFCSNYASLSMQQLKRSHVTGGLFC